MHVELAAHQEAHRGGKLGLGFQHLWRLFLDDEGAAGDKRWTLRGEGEGEVESTNLEMTFFHFVSKGPL